MCVTCRIEGGRRMDFCMHGRGQLQFSDNKERQ